MGVSCVYPCASFKLSKIEFSLGTIYISEEPTTKLVEYLGTVLLREAKGNLLCIHKDFKFFFLVGDGGLCVMGVLYAGDNYSVLCCGLLQNIILRAVEKRCRGFTAPGGSIYKMSFSMKQIAMSSIYELHCCGKRVANILYV